MTTITALNAKLGLDASNFVEGAELARAEVNRVAAIMRQSVPPSERYQRDLDLLNKTFSESGKQSAAYANAVAHLTRQHQAAAPAIEKTSAATKQSTSATTAAMGELKRLAAAYVGLQTVTKAITLATEVEDATVAFEVLTGSVNDGRLLFEQIRKFAETSPITFSNAQQATRTMLSFGVAAQDVQKNLQMLSDVTGGNNERFKMLSLAFSQTSAAGRLMGQDLLQMINSGFNPLQQISRTTGESLLDLKKRMEDGAISADEVRQAFVDATSEGGMFFGMTERLADTVGGKLNIALSELEKSLAAAGNAMGPMLVTILDAFTRLKPVLDAIVNLIDGISQGLGFAVAAVTDLINSVSTFSVDTTAMNKFLDMLEKRERERAVANQEQAAREFENNRQAVDKVAEAEKRAAEQANADRLKAIKEQQEAMQKAWKERQEQIEKERRARQRAAEEAKKAQLRAQQEAERAFNKELEDARREALEFFRQREEQTKQRRDDVARGPGAGMEIGSADYVNFFADRANATIAKAAVPDDPVVLQRELARKTAELLLAQREANARQAQQIELAKLQLAELRENRFQRIR